MKRLKMMAQIFPWPWLLAGAIVLSLMGFSEAYATWLRMSTSLQSTLNRTYYFAAVIISTCLWLVIAITINWIRQIIPLTPPLSVKNWFIHIITGFSLGSLHLVVNVVLLWWVFSGSFRFTDAYIETLARWLPYEVIAYWACLAVMTVFSRRAEILVDNRSFLKKQTIALKDKDEIVLLRHEDIDSVEALDNYVVIWSREKRYIHKASMKQIEMVLDAKYFKRVHRSTIVNLNRVEKLVTIDNQLFVMLKSGKQLAISRRKKSEIKAVLTKH